MRVCKLLPDTLNQQQAVDVSAAISERLRQRRIHAILGRRPVNRDDLDTFCERLPELLP
jgi:hypothetical protein